MRRLFLPVASALLLLFSLQTNAIRTLHLLEGSSEARAYDRLLKGSDIMMLQAYDSLLVLGECFHHGDSLTAAAVSCGDIEVWATGLCEKLPVQSRSGKVHFRRIDHQQYRCLCTFNDNKFDLILMRKGLCVCNPGAVSCAGLDYEHHSLLHNFFTEVIRVLNKKKTSAKAFLGASLGNLKGDHIAVLDQVLQRIEDLYPNIAIVFVYFERATKNPAVFQSVLRGIEIRSSLPEQVTS